MNVLQQITTMVKRGNHKEKESDKKKAGFFIDCSQVIGRSAARRRKVVKEMGKETK